MRPRHALLAAVTLAALALAGCSGAGTPAAPATTTTPPAPDNGISAMAPADILTKSLAAVTAAGSVHLTGQVDTDMVDVLASGGNLQLTSTGSDGNLEARLIGTDLYYKGDATFYKMLFPAPQGDQMATTRAGKWVKSSTAKDPQISNVVSLLTPANIVQVLVLAATPTKGATSQINGQPVIELKIASPAGNGSLFIATTGAPVPVQVKLDRLKDPINISYGAAQTIAPPPTVDITA
jgi:hypothetical protein